MDASLQRIAQVPWGMNDGKLMQDGTPVILRRRPKTQGEEELIIIRMATHQTARTQAARCPVCRRGWAADGSCRAVRKLRISLNEFLLSPAQIVRELRKHP